MASGGYHDCALLRDASVWCWSQVSLADEQARAARLAAELQRVRGLPAVQSVVVGDEHACALARTGETFCWGSHRLGRLLDPALPESGVRTPARIRGLPAFVRVWAGGAHTCGQSADGVLHCWGGLYTLRGISSDRGRPGPLVSPRDGPVTAVSVGAGESCAVQASGGVMCWRVGHDINEGGIHPRPFDVVDIPGVGDVVALAAGEKHGCARSRDGQIRCWGDREDDLVNGGEEARRTAVRRVPGEL